MIRRASAASWAPARSPARALALCALVAPFGLAFFSGGYFPQARSWAGAVCWGLLALALAFRAGRTPHTKAAVLALVTLGLYAGWTALSLLWAPDVDAGYGYVSLAVLYLGSLALAGRLFRRRIGQWVEPGLALGCLIVVGYGISERLAPGLLQFARSQSAQGRLDQPLTYWNAMGELAAIGFVLCVRLAADPRRSARLRAAAASAAPVIGLGVYLSFSRGALFAAAAGLLSLVVLARTRAQFKAVATAVGGTVIVCLVAAPLSGVTSLSGPLDTREAQGALLLFALILVVGLSALARHRPRRWQALSGTDLERQLPLPRRAGTLTLVVVSGMLAIAVIAGAKEGSGRPLSGGASRLGTLQSNRYAYWSVALDAFAAHPLEGVGAGGWAVEWLGRRHVKEFAKDAHSLPVQTLAELGLVGLGILGMFLIAVALSARQALRADRVAGCGLAAGVVTWAAHQPLDWDWELPALTLVAFILAGTLLALADPAGGAERPQ